MKRKCITLLAISALLVGCGGDTTSNNRDATSDNVLESSTTKIPAYKTINNKGTGVEGKLGNYIVKLFANNNEQIKPQERHQGVVVKYDGQTSETMAIQSSYQGKKIVAVIYNGDNIVKVSDSITVTDVPVVVIKVK